MRAIVTRKLGNPPEMAVEERPKPALRKGHSLVRMKSATINQLSRFLRQGDMGERDLPIVLGNEGAGIVEESENLAAGSKVMIYGGNKLGITEDGLFQEWAVVEDSRLFPIPDTLGFEEASTLPVNYLTAYRALTKTVRLQRGQSAIISGATGSVGHALVQVTKALGGNPIAVVSTSQKAERVKAASVIDLSAADLREAVMAITDGKGADFGFDPVGGEILNQLLKSVSWHGVVVSIGFPGGKQAEVDIVDMIVGEKTLTAYSLHRDDDAEIAASLRNLSNLAAEGHLRPLIDTVVTMENFEDGYSRLVSRNAIGSIVLRL